MNTKTSPLQAFTPPASVLLPGSGSVLSPLLRLTDAAIIHKIDMSADMPTTHLDPVSPGSGLPTPAIRGARHGPSRLRQLAQLLGVAAAATAAYFVITQFLLQTVEVVGVSMLPTL